MLFADLQTFFGQGLLFLFIGLAVLVHLCKKAIGSNEAIKSAAKEIATKKAVGFLQRFLK